MDASNGFDDVKADFEWLDPILDYWPGGELALSHCAWDPQSKDQSTRESSGQPCMEDLFERRFLTVNGMQRSTESSEQVRPQ